MTKQESIQSAHLYSKFLALPERCMCIGEGRFRILGERGARFRILGEEGQGGGGGQIPSRHMSSY